MCGLYGFIGDDKKISAQDSLIFYRLFLNSRRRGRDSSSIIYVKNQEIVVVRFNSSPKIKMLIEIFKAYVSQSFIVLGHTRLTTHSYSDNPNDSNQPIIRGESILLHNGIHIDNSELMKNYISDTDLLSVKLNLEESIDSRIDILKKAQGEISIILLDLK